MNRIIAYFSIGTGEVVECRAVLYNDTFNRDAVEKRGVDGLGASAWIPLGQVKGLPSIEIIVRRVAFELATDRGRENSKVSRSPAGIVVQLGQVR